MTRTTLDAAAATWEAIDSLTPWAQNPRNNDEAVEQVAESIRRFGFASPIIARAADRSVIAGHTRLKAAQQLGLDLVPVRFVELDEDEARALALADNKLNEIATWDDGALSDVLRELEDAGVDLSGLGWDEEDLSSLGAGSVAEGDWSDAFAALPGEDPEFTNMTFSLTHAQAAEVRSALKRAASIPFEETGNKNENGNALARIAGAYNG